MEATASNIFLVFWTALIQTLLWRDRKLAAKSETAGSLADSDDLAAPGSDYDEKKAVRTEISSPT